MYALQVPSKKIDATKTMPPDTLLQPSSVLRPSDSSLLYASSSDDDVLVSMIIVSGSRIGQGRDQDLEVLHTKHYLIVVHMQLHRVQYSVISQPAPMLFLSLRIVVDMAQRMTTQVLTSMSDVLVKIL